MPQRPVVDAGGLIFVSDIVSEARDADITSQTREVLERLGTVLSEAGTDLAHAATVHVYVRRAADFAAMNEVYRTFWKSAQPSRTTVVADLPGEALIAVSAVAVRRGVKRKVVTPAGWGASPLPYSYAVRAGDVVFLSGLIARDRETGQPVAGSVTDQLDLIVSNAREILDATGLSLDQVVSARVFLPDASTFLEMNDAWRTHFGAAKPARATVIAGLMQPAYRIEVTLVAHAASVERFTADPPSPNLSGVVRAGKLVSVSGMLAPGPGDIVTQTRDTLARARAALARAGATPADVVETTVYLPDIGQASAMDAAYRETFRSAPPARVTIGAGLVAKDARIEISMSAVLK